jgi:probable phosphoglycerate mutase
LTPVLLIRHGPTSWNASGRIQGQTDVGLSPRGRAEVQRWRLPAAWAQARVLSSPLGRARETAVILTGRAPALDPRLSEMSWGRFEGRRLSELRAEAADAMAANEARGLDFRPPGGESPREVCARLQSLLVQLAADPRPVVAVCHKGVMRAALVLATGWDMRGRPPLRLLRALGCALCCHRDGRVELGAPVPLAVARQCSGTGA